MSPVQPTIKPRKVFYKQFVSTEKTQRSLSSSLYAANPNGQCRWRSGWRHGLPGANGFDGARQRGQVLHAVKQRAADDQGGNAGDAVSFANQQIFCYVFGVALADERLIQISRIQSQLAGQIKQNIQLANVCVFIEISVKNGFVKGVKTICVRAQAAAS